MSTNATLIERANEYAKRTNDYGSWDMADLVREYEADTGETTTAGELAYAMLDFVEGDLRDDLGNLTDCDSRTEDDMRANVMDQIRDVQRVMSGIETAERGEYVYRADVRALLAEWGVRPLCRGCQGGKAPLCAECQSAVLGPTLVASVAVTAREVST